MPKVSVEEFLKNITRKTVARGESQEITLLFNYYEVKCRVTNPDRKGTSHEVLQIRYDSDKDFKKYLLDSFGYSEE